MNSGIYIFSWCLTDGVLPSDFYRENSLSRGLIHNNKYKSPFSSVIHCLPQTSVHED